MITQRPDGRIRMCADYKGTINPIIENEEYPMPTADELFNKMQGGQKFTKIDLSNAYMQVELDEDSQKYCVINTCKGLRQPSRLLYGAKPASGMFQKLMESNLQNIPRTVVKIDDVMTTGIDDEDHIQNVAKIFETLEELGVTVNINKCKFFEDEVEYNGFIVDKNGVRTNSTKVEAVTKLPAPTTVKELQAFLGAINYYSKYIKDFASIASPLFILLQKEVEWEWHGDQQKSFDKLKKCLSEAPVLMIYDKDLPLKLDTDASSHGLGAVLSHILEDGSERPIAYASRSLRGSELRYAQVDKEGAAVIFAVGKFQQYLMGRRFQLVVDNKAISRIFHPCKQMGSVAANRLSRWALTLTNLDFDIIYRKSEEHANADMLSRLPIRTESEVCQDELFHVESGSIPVTSDTVKRGTKTDQVLQKVKRYLENDSWPTKLSQDVKPYASIKDELSIEQDELIVWGMRVVIPALLREKMLRELHHNHPGIVRMKRLARMHMWYPGINQDIERLVRNCDNCLKVSNCPAASVPHPWEAPSAAMERIHLDYIGPYNKTYILLMVDVYSGWIEAQTINNPNTTMTLKILRKWISRYGIPVQVVSDNGTQFTSKEFSEFLKEYAIDHVTSPAYHQSSNGAAERAVQTLKKGLAKNDSHSLSIQERIDQYLFSYRTTPKDNGDTPSRRFMGRTIRNRLDFIKPVQKSSNTCPIPSLRTFEINDSVLVKTENRSKLKCIPGKVRGKIGAKCYMVQVPGRPPIKKHIDQLISWQGRLENEDEAWNFATSSNIPEMGVPLGSNGGPSQNESTSEERSNPKR